MYPLSPLSTRRSLTKAAAVLLPLLTVLALITPVSLSAGEAPTVGSLTFLTLAQDASVPGPSLGEPAVARAGVDLIVQSTVQGTAPIALQWWFNKEPLPGATNASFRIPALERADEGRYSLTASNAFGRTATLDTPLFVSTRNPEYRAGSRWRP